MIRAKARPARLLVITLIISLLFASAPSSVASAEDTRTLRVGYVFTEGYQEGGDGEHKTGFGYDYYQKISYYTGWEYEYVYGGFGELLEKLKAGEIDIMGNLSYTDERAQYIDFSEREQGDESFYLYTTKANTEIDESNLEPINGKRVGISEGSIQYGMFLDWCKEKGIVCEVLQYSDKDQREEALNSGDIDATVVPSLMADDPAYANWRAAVKIGYAPYYFGVSKKCDSAVKSELDMALDAIFDANPNYYEEQFNSYYGGKMLESDFWTAEEQRYLTKHKNRIRIGYLDNYLPFCDKDDNDNPAGLLADITRVTSDSLGIKFDCIMFSRYDEMKAALDAGNLDVIFPVRGDYWAAEQQNLFISDTVCGSNSLLVFKGNYSEKTTRCIAISDACPFQRYSAIINYPNAELLVCQTTKDCIKAVLDGRAGSAIYSYEYYETNADKLTSADNLNQTEIPDSANVCFGVRHGDTAAISLCEKWMKIVGDDFINQSLVTNSNVERSFTLLAFIRANPIGILIAAGAIILVISVYAILYVRNAKKQNMKLLEATRDAEKSKRELIEQELKAKSYRIQMEKELNSSRIKVMMSQIRPHFLYNSLSAIQTIVKVDPDYAYNLIFDFTTYLRSSITALNSDKPIPFSQEMKNIEAYMNIEKMRFGEALKVEYDIRCDSFSVLPLSIQPFAENATRHGIFPKAEEGGTVIVRSYERDDAYVVEIEDDGVGFDVEKALDGQSEAVGLKNTIFRLKTLYHASVSIESEIGRGTKVTVVIPKTDTEGEAAE